MKYDEIISEIKSLANPESVKGMAKFGINPDNTYGVSIPELRKIAKNSGKNHALALKLWASGIHEARILASIIDDSKMVTEEQMKSWVIDFDSWDVCDQCCLNLFNKTAFAHKKVIEWSKRDEEFVKRAAFALIAILAVHDKKLDDKELEKFLSLIKQEAKDERNYVKKAVNWALRQIGKRNANLNKAAINAAKEIQKYESKAAKWIACDALRELTGNTVNKKLKL